MRIRPALTADAAAIRALAQRAYGHYVESIGLGRPWPMDIDYAEAIRDHDVFVVADPHVVGYVVLAPAPDHLLVDNIAVEPDRQGEGIGQALLAYAEERAEAAGLPAMRLYTNAGMTENIAFYGRRGYREVERRREDGFDRVFFVKDLD